MSKCRRCTVIENCGSHKGNNKGIVRSIEWRKGMGKTWRGKHQPQEMREKISSTMAGRVFSEEHKANLRKAKPPRSVEHSEKISASLKGIIPWNKGLRTAKKYTFIGSAMYCWRKAVLQRDNYTCQICGVTSTNLDVDHIVSRWADIGLVYTVSNGRALCRECHQKTETYGVKATRKPKEFQIPLPLVT